jgi:two-component system cell cycle sensor histidine kinase/response regulator CckA
VAEVATAPSAAPKFGEMRGQKWEKPVVVEEGTREPGSGVESPGPEEHWRSLFEFSPDFILTVDLDYRITSLNRSRKGVSVERLVGRGVLELPRLADRDQARALLDRVRATGKAEIYQVAWTDDAGDCARFESRCIPVLRDGAVVSFMVVTRDVSDERRAHEDLAASEERFRTLIERSADAICLFDERGVIRYANPATKRILNYEPQWLVGRDGWELIHPDDQAAMRSVLMQLLAEPGASMEVTRYRLRHSDGTWRWMDTVATNLMHAPGVRAIVATYRDVSGRVRAEEKQAQAQKMEAIGLLAGGVAHDFNNLLTVILGYSDRAAQHLDAGHPAAADLAYVRQAADRAVQLTQKLLTFARHQIRQPSLFDARELLGGIGGMLERILGEDISVTIDLPSSPLYIEGDLGQLQQLLLNLCTNARQAMPSGGRLRLRASAVGVEVELEVTDTGLGMGEETRARIFEPFFTTRPGGTGLGLSVVHGVVQEHHGSINVESKPGQGTTVRVRLPRRERPMPVPGRAAEEKAGGGETLLLAEDEPLVRELMARTLRRQGYEVLVASDGQEAVELFAREKERIALVVLDAIMPRLGGRQAFARMEEMRPGLKALFVSGYAPDVVGMAELISAGQVAMLSKPFMASDLSSRIRILLERR